MSEPDPSKKGARPGIAMSPEDKARQRRRSKAIAWAVVGLVVLFYVITVLKMGPAILNRSL